MAKNKAGRPPKFKSKEDLEKKIQAYFDSCFEEVWEDRPKRDDKGDIILDKDGNKIEEHVKVRKNIRPLTITGLATALDTTRETLLDYQGKKRYSDTIKKAKGMIENFTEEKLFSNNVAGVIFNLKNNYDWKDSAALELSGSKDNPLPPIKIKIVEPKDGKTEIKRDRCDGSIPKEPGQPEEDKGE
jgi:hypothetical protein